MAPQILKVSFILTILFVLTMNLKIIERGPDDQVIHHVCPSESYWNEKYKTCVYCPNAAYQMDPQKFICMKKQI